MSAERKADAMGTDDIVQAALREAEEEKKAKKHIGPEVQKQGKQSKKGKTLEEVEEEEGGTIKESRVPMAKTLRSQQRKGKSKDTDLVDDAELVEVEEALEQEEDDGFKLEPFNLAQERAEGFFDEGGHYVERKDEDEDEKDAWFASAKESVLSDAQRARIEEQQRRAAEAEAAPAMSGPHKAELQRRIAARLLRGETVTEALKRLRPPPARGAKRGAHAGNLSWQLYLDFGFKNCHAACLDWPLRCYARPSATKRGAPKAERPPEEAAALAAFDEVTEAASALMDSGELDVYSAAREEFERAAAAFPAPGQDEDMFGDDDGAERPGPSAGPSIQNGGAEAAEPSTASHAAPLEAARGGPTSRAAEQPQHGARPHLAPQAANGCASAAAPVAAPEAVVEEVDYASWPVKELRRFLTERGSDPAGIVEKADLVARVKEAASRGPEGEVAQAPPGFAFDPGTGYFYSAEAGLYYDANTGGYYSSSTQKWYSYDAAAQQYVEWPDAAPD